jgi:hypothetical protein
MWDELFEMGGWRAAARMRPSIVDGNQSCETVCTTRPRRLSSEAWRVLFLDNSEHYGIKADNFTFLSWMCLMDPAIVAVDAAVDEEPADAARRYDSSHPVFSNASPLWTIPVSSQTSTPVLQHVG